MRRYVTDIGSFSLSRPVAGEPFPDSWFPDCNPKRENTHAQTHPYRDPRRGAHTTIRPLSISTTASPPASASGCCPHQGECVWKIVSDDETVSVGEARSLASEMLAAIKREEDVPCRTDEVLFEAVAATVFRQHEPVRQCCERSSCRPCAMCRARRRRYRRSYRSAVSDGVDAPSRRHRDVPRWRCCQRHDKGGGVHGTGYHHRD